MNEEGAKFLLRAFVLSELIHKHVYNRCDCFMAFHEMGLPDPKEFPAKCPRCGDEIEREWDFFRVTHAENMGQAWQAAETYCYHTKRGFSLDYLDHRRCRVRLFDAETNQLVIPELQGDHACLVLSAAIVWEHLGEGERKHYLKE